MSKVEVRAAETGRCCASPHQALAAPAVAASSHSRQDQSAPEVVTGPEAAPEPGTGPPPGRGLLTGTDHGTGLDWTQCNTMRGNAKQRNARRRKTTVKMAVPCTGHESSTLSWWWSQPGNTTLLWHNVATNGQINATTPLIPFLLHNLSVMTRTASRPAGCRAVCRRTCRSRAPARRGTEGRVAACPSTSASPSLLLVSYVCLGWRICLHRIAHRGCAARSAGAPQQRPGRR